ncbi:hypothetical protein C805_01512 [Eubacterium sp. 14-2]|nr:hypothetical protein C805_01512 [Eubacterium sp. 14-2]
MSLNDETDTFFITTVDGKRFIVTVSPMTEDKSLTELWEKKNSQLWKLIGWHSDSECSLCGQKTIFHIYRYDSWCCTACNLWLDDTCDDPDCPFCSSRPPTPLEAYNIIDTEADSAIRKKDWRRKNYQHKMDGMWKHKKQRETILRCKKADRSASTS